MSFPRVPCRLLFTLPLICCLWKWKPPVTPSAGNSRYPHCTIHVSSEWKLCGVVQHGKGFIFLLSGRYTGNWKLLLFLSCWVISIWVYLLSLVLWCLEVSENHTCSLLQLERNGERWRRPPLFNVGSSRRWKEQASRSIFGKQKWNRKPNSPFSPLFPLNLAFYLRLLLMEKRRSPFPQKCFFFRFAATPADAIGIIIPNRSGNTVFTFICCWILLFSREWISLKQRIYSVLSFHAW